MKLRPYQADCLASIRGQLTANRSTLVVMATGLGKTVVFAHAAHAWPDRVLVIAHRDELIRQAAGKVKAVTGDVPGIEMGDERIHETAFDGPPKVVVSSVQTMSRENRRTRFQPDEFGLIVIDEAHHAVAQSYRSILDYFAAAKVLGVTATPQRADELALGQVFESVAWDYGIVPAVEDGWLVPVRQKVVVIDGLDFSGVRTTAGDLNEGDLEQILIEEKFVHQMAKPTIDLAGDRSALVFCVTVKHAKLMAEILNRYKPDCAIALSGETAKDERRYHVDRFKAGEIQILCNCALFLEGFDAPNTAIVVNGRPTKSPVLYTQVLGRGTRPLPGVVDGLETADARKAAIRGSSKPNMLSLDFVGNSGRHRIVTAADILGGKFGVPVRDYARKTLEEEGGEADIDYSLMRAEAELALLDEERERRIEAYRRREILARVEYRTEDVSPFDGGAPDRRIDVADRATDGQVRYLIRLGVSRSRAESYTKRQASAVIDKLKARQGVAA